MKLDELVKQRFQELTKKAETIANAKKPAQIDGTPVSGYAIPEPEFLGWVTNVTSLLQRIFGENSPHYKDFQKCVQGAGNFYLSLNTLQKCNAILQASKEDYEGGYLFNLRALTAAELFDDALEQATELLNTGYKDPACIVTGVTLETTLKELCTRNSIPHAKLDTMNVALCKAGTYNLPKQKQITAWADLRNNAAHGNGIAYTKEDVAAFIEGVNRFIADYL